MINVINVNKFIREGKLKGPITSPQIFMGKSYTPHPEGLHSEEIFGLDGSPERRNSMSWIDLNCNVIHPVFYDIVSKQIEKKIVKLISNEEMFTINEETGELVQDEEGELTGFSSFVKNIDKIKFRRAEEGSKGNRNKVVSVLEKNIKNNTFFINKLIVIAPDYRPIFYSESDDRPTIDELNDIYKSIIILSNQLKSVSGPLFDILSYKMQMYMKELFEWVKSKVSKKHGIIRRMMLGKRVDFSARSVISPNPNLKLGEVGIPLNTACGLFEPNLIYGIVNSPYSKDIPDEFHEEVKSFLGKELLPDLT